MDLSAKLLQIRCYDPDILMHFGVLSDMPNLDFGKTSSVEIEIMHPLQSTLMSIIGSTLNEASNLADVNINCEDYSQANVLTACDLLSTDSNCSGIIEILLAFFDVYNFLTMNRISQTSVNNILDLLEKADYLSAVHSGTAPYFLKYILGKDLAITNDTRGVHLLFKHLHCFGEHTLGFKCTEDPMLCWQHMEYCFKTETASAIGHIGCLESTLKLGGIILLDTINSAARAGRLEVLEYIVQRCDFPDSSSTTAVAAGAGQYKCLVFLIKNGFRFKASAAAAAAMGNHYDCFEFLVQNGCPIGVITADTAALAGNYECLEFLIKNGYLIAESTAAAAARGGSVKCLELLVLNGCPVDVSTTIAAAEGGHLGCIIYCHTMEFEWDWRTTHAAAEAGHFECLQYLLINGCECGITCGLDDDHEFCELTISAAKGGNVQCLKLAVERGCVYNEDTIAAAADGGHLACIIYARSIGCPWDWRAMAFAAHFESNL